MTMKLVSKNFRGELIRWLTHDEYITVKNNLFYNIIQRK